MSGRVSLFRIATVSGPGVFLVGNKQEAGARPQGFVWFAAEGSALAARGTAATVAPRMAALFTMLPSSRVIFTYSATPGRLDSESGNASQAERQARRSTAAMSGVCRKYVARLPGPSGVGTTGPQHRRALARGAQPVDLVKHHAPGWSMSNPAAAKGGIGMRVKTSFGCSR